jgi:hypothetical protein
MTARVLDTQDFLDLYFLGCKVNAADLAYQESASLLIASCR